MQNIKIQLSNLFGCSGVRIYSNQRKSRLPAMLKLTIPVTISLSCLLFLSGLLSILCLFSQPVQHNNRSFNPLTISHPAACRHVHTYTALPQSLAAPPFLSSSVTHINPPPPPPPNKSLPLPSLTPNHLLPLTWNNCETIKTLGKHQIPHHSRGGWRLQKSYWQKAMNETERMAEFQTQENCNVPKL